MEQMSSLRQRMEMAIELAVSWEDGIANSMASAGSQLLAQEQPGLWGLCVTASDTCEVSWP